MTVLCEVGPGTVRIVASDCEAAAGAVETVLAAGVEPWALLDEQAIPTAELWHRVFEPLLTGAARALLVHPSWWSPAQVDLVSAAAGAHAGAVTTMPRRAVHGAEIFVEIGPRFVAIGGAGRVIGAETRCAEVETVVDRVVGRIGAGPDRVLIDAPAGVPGADALGAMIARRLRRTGRSVHHLSDRRLLAAAQPAIEARARPPTARFAGILAAVAVVLIGAAIGARHIPEKPSSTTDLIEGRVAVRIPGDWVVRRVTDGPGSARVEVSAPSDPDAVLHVTQSPASTSDLAATAATLRAAIDAQPAGVFVDFNGADTRAGRPAVTYRELRTGREIAWTVLVTGRVRIAIGCRRVPGPADRVEAACAQAIESAREIG